MLDVALIVTVAIVALWAVGSVVVWLGKRLRKPSTTAPSSARESSGSPPNPLVRAQPSGKPLYWIEDAYLILSEDKIPSHGARQASAVKLRVAMVSPSGTLLLRNTTFKLGIKCRGMEGTALFQVLPDDAERQDVKVRPDGDIELTDQAREILVHLLPRQSDAVFALLEQEGRKDRRIEIGVSLRCVVVNGQRSERLEDPHFAWVRGLMPCAWTFDPFANNG